MRDLMCTAKLCNAKCLRDIMSNTEMSTSIMYKYIYFCPINKYKQNTVSNHFIET